MYYCLSINLNLSFIAFYNIVETKFFNLNLIFLMFQSYNHVNKLALIPVTFIFFLNLYLRTRLVIVFENLLLQKQISFYLVFVFRTA